MGDNEPNSINAPGEENEEWPLFSCGTHDLHEQLLASDNHYKNTRANISAVLEQSTLWTNRVTSHIRIPVVVHVIWHTEDQKISMEQVQNQIDSLNRDYNLQNKDTQDVPSRWKDRVANPNISFFLTKRDPAGKAHDGVVWVWTDVSRFGKKDRRMKLAEKGSPGWDSTRFLNIWVCNMTEFLGFATYPGHNSALDGAVIQWDVFGSLGKNINPSYNLGRTTVHEVGHWLNLPHPFDREQGEVSDTTRVPVTPEGKNFGKPLYPVVSTMIDGKTNKAEGGDMFMNFMDYADDDTTIMFTKGQVERMRVTLMTQRRSVFWSDFKPLRSQDTSFEPSDDKTVYMLLEWYQGYTSLVGIKTTKAAPQTTCIQVTDKEGDFTSAPKSIETKLPDLSSEDRLFTLARCQGDEHPSLFAIRRSGATSGFVEVSIFSPDSYSEGETMKTILPAIKNPKIWSFAFVNWAGISSSGLPDLVAIKQSDTTNAKVEVHVLSSNVTESGKYHTWLAHRYTALDEIDDEAYFMFTDWNGDGTLDLAVVQRKGDKSGWLVDILAGAANYRDFLVRTEVGSSTLNVDKAIRYDFAMTDMTGDGRPDLVAIQKSGGAKVELIVLAG